MKLETELKQMRYHFGEGFVSDVMKRVKQEAGRSMGYFIRRWQPVIGWGIAACLVVVAGLMLYTEGRINADAMIGLSGFSEIELSELLAGN